jgi:predicted DNA binding CopG/RHH family protein
MSKKKVEIRLPDGNVLEGDLGPDVDLEAEDVRDSQGRRVTQARADAAVRAVRKAQRGRPSIDEEGDSPRVQFRVPTSLLEKARARADAEGKTLSQFAREAFEEKLAA